MVQDEHLEVEHQVEAVMSVQPEEKTESFQWILEHDKNPIKLVLSLHKDRPTHSENATQHQFGLMQSGELSSSVKLDKDVKQNVTPVERPHVEKSGGLVVQKPGPAESEQKLEEIGNVRPKPMELIQLREKVQSYDILQPEHILELIEWMQRQHGSEPDEPTIKHEKATPVEPMLMKKDSDDSVQMREIEPTSERMKHEEKSNGSGAMSQNSALQPNFIAVQLAQAKHDKSDRMQPNQTFQGIKQQQQKFVEILNPGKPEVLDESGPLVQIMEQLGSFQAEGNVIQPMLGHGESSKKPDQQEQWGNRVESFESIQVDQKLTTIENVNQPDETKLPIGLTWPRNDEFESRQPETSTEFTVVEQPVEQTTQSEKKVDELEVKQPEKNSTLIEQELRVMPMPFKEPFETHDQDAEKQFTASPEFLFPDENTKQFESMPQKPIESQQSEQKMETPDQTKSEWLQSGQNGDQTTPPMSKENERVFSLDVSHKLEVAQEDEKHSEIVQSDLKEMVPQPILLEQGTELIDRTKVEAKEQTSESLAQVQNNETVEMIHSTQRMETPEFNQSSHSDTLAIVPFVRKENLTESIQTVQQNVELDGNNESLQPEHFEISETKNVSTQLLLESERKPLGWIESEQMKMSDEIVHRPERNETPVESDERKAVPLELMQSQERESQVNSSARGYKKKPSESVKQVKKVR